MGAGLAQDFGPKAGGLMIRFPVGPGNHLPYSRCAGAGRLLLAGGHGRPMTNAKYAELPGEELFDKGRKSLQCP